MCPRSMAYAGYSARGHRSGAFPSGIPRMRHCCFECILVEYRPVQALGRPHDGLQWCSLRGSSHLVLHQLRRGRPHLASSPESNRGITAVVPVGALHISRYLRPFKRFQVWQAPLGHQDRPSLTFGWVRQRYPCCTVSATNNGAKAEKGQDTDAAGLKIPLKYRQTWVVRVI